MGDIKQRIARISKGIEGDADQKIRFLLERYNELERLTWDLPTNERYKYFSEMQEEVDSGKPINYTDLHPLYREQKQVEDEIRKLGGRLSHDGILEEITKEQIESIAKRFKERVVKWRLDNELENKNQ